MTTDRDHPPAGSGRVSARHCCASILVGALVTLVSASALASLPRGGSETESRVILFAPWLVGDQALARSFAAGYRVLGHGRFANSVVVVPESPSRPLPQGAWLSLTVGRFLGCLGVGPVREQR